MWTPPLGSTVGSIEQAGGRADMGHLTYLASPTCGNLAMKSRPGVGKSEPGPKPPPKDILARRTKGNPRWTLYYNVSVPDGLMCKTKALIDLSSRVTSPRICSCKNWLNHASTEADGQSEGFRWGYLTIFDPYIHPQMGILNKHFPPNSNGPPPPPPPG